MDIKELFEKNYIDLNTILDSILEGVIIASPSRSFLFWNKAAKQILEDGPESDDDVQEWAKRFRIFDPETNEYIAFQDLPMVKALNGEEYYDYRLMTKNLSHPEGIILSVNGKPLRSGNATIGGVTTFRDITDQIRQEKILNSERDFYQRFLDLMPGIVFIKDPSGTYIYGNKSFHDLLGVQSVQGTTSDDYLIKEMAREVYDHDKIVMNTLTPHDFKEIIHWKDGTQSVFRTTRFPYFGENNELKGVCVVAKDITKEMQTQLALEQERNRSALISKHAAIGVLSTEIAHEIKNPLAILQSACDVLNSALNDEVINRDLIREKLKVINETIARMDKVSSSLGTLARDGTVEKDTVTTLRVIIGTVISLCSYKTRKLNIDIQIIESDALDDKILCNQTQISEVILNLIMNALDAVEHVSNPEIKISVGHSEKGLACRVWDNGNGVQDNIREKIFEPFFTTKEHDHGTGLGLSISKRIMEKHNGNLYYDQTKTGHCFVVEIPIQ